MPQHKSRTENGWSERAHIARLYANWFRMKTEFTDENYLFSLSMSRARARPTSIGRWCLSFPCGFALDVVSLKIIFSSSFFFNELLECIGTRHHNDAVHWPQRCVNRNCNAMAKQISHLTFMIRMNIPENVALTAIFGEIEKKIDNRHNSEIYSPLLDLCGDGENCRVRNSHHNQKVDTTLVRCESSKWEHSFGRPLTANVIFFIHAPSFLCIAYGHC